MILCNLVGTDPIKRLGSLNQERTEIVLANAILNCNCKGDLSKIKLPPVSSCLQMISMRTG